jgi:LmbE family N-acetylglucosaminyl deacetylase
LPHSVKEIWLAGYEQAHHFVDAGPFLSAKVEAILCHRSQLGGAGPDAAPAWVYEWMRWAGRKAGCEFAEHFRRIELS